MISKRIGLVVILSLVLSLLVEWFLSRSGTSTFAWQTPVRLAFWLTFFGSAIAWVVLNLQQVTPLEATPSARHHAKHSVAEQNPVAPPIDALPSISECVRGGCLLPREPLVSRANERQRLSEWMRGGKTSICVLHGRGGVGKSTLAWHWLRTDVVREPVVGQLADSVTTSAQCALKKDARPATIYWWSFEECASSFLAMVEDLAEYLADGRSFPKAMANPSAKLGYVIDELSRRDVLIVLDAFELVLSLHAEPATYYHADRVSTEIDETKASCHDPLASEFLDRFASMREASRLLLITRHIPAELEAKDASSQRKALRHHLDVLSPNECMSWFERAGIKGDGARLMVAARIGGYRPLAMQATIGLARADATSPGYIDSVVENPLLAKVQTSHQVLRAAVAALDRDSRDFLARLSATRGLIPGSLVAQIATASGIKDACRTLTLLTDRGLALIDGAGGAVSVHPLVRAVAYDRLPDAPGHHRTLAGIVGKSAVSPASYRDAIDLSERYHHLAMAGLYDQARELYRESLGKQLLALGDLASAARCLMMLLPGGVGNAPVMDKGSSNAAATRALGDVLTYLGQPDTAIRVYQVAVENADRWRTRQTVDLDYLAIAKAQLSMGRLRDAAENLAKAEEACVAAGEELRRAMVQQEKARLLLIEGNIEEAAEPIEVAVAIAERWRVASESAEVMMTQAQWNLAAGQTLDAVDVARQALTLAESEGASEHGLPLTLIRARSLTARALVAQAHLEEEHAARKPFLDEAMDHCHAAAKAIAVTNLYAADPALQWLRATIMEARGELDQAANEAAKALGGARKRHARLVEADLHLLLANIHRRKGRAESALAELEAARESSWCDGPPHCYKAGLEIAAEAISS